MFYEAVRVTRRYHPVGSRAPSGRALGRVLDFPTVELRSGHRAFAPVRVHQLVEVGTVKPGACVGPAAEHSGERIHVVVLHELVQPTARTRIGVLRQVVAPRHGAIAVRVAFAHVRCAGEDDAASAARRVQNTYRPGVRVTAFGRHHACRMLGVRQACACPGEHAGFDAHERVFDAHAVFYGGLGFDDRLVHDFDGVVPVAVHPDPLPWVGRVFRFPSEAAEVTHHGWRVLHGLARGLVLRRVQETDQQRQHARERGIEIIAYVPSPQSMHRHHQMVAAAAQVA